MAYVSSFCGILIIPQITATSKHNAASRAIIKVYSEVVSSHIPVEIEDGLRKLESDLYAILD